MDSPSPNSNPGGNSSSIYRRSFNYLRSWFNSPPLEQLQKDNQNLALEQLQKASQNLTLEQLQKASQNLTLEQLQKASQNLTLEQLQKASQNLAEELATRLNLSADKQEAFNLRGETVGKEAREGSGCPRPIQKETGDEWADHERGMELKGVKIGSRPKWPRRP